MYYVKNGDEVTPIDYDTTIYTLCGKCGTEMSCTFEEFAQMVQSGSIHDTLYFCSQKCIDVAKAAEKGIRVVE